MAGRGWSGRADVPGRSYFAKLSACGEDGRSWRCSACSRVRSGLPRRGHPPGRSALVSAALIQHVAADREPGAPRLQWVGRAQAAAVCEPPGCCCRFFVPPASRAAAGGALSRRANTLWAAPRCLGLGEACGLIPSVKPSQLRWTEGGCHCCPPAAAAAAAACCPSSRADCCSLLALLLFPPAGLAPQLAAAATVRAICGAGADARAIVIVLLHVCRSLFIILAARSPHYVVPITALHPSMPACSPMSR